MSTLARRHLEQYPDLPPVTVVTLDTVDPKIPTIRYELPDGSAILETADGRWYPGIHGDRLTIANRLLATLPADLPPAPFCPPRLLPANGDWTLPGAVTDHTSSIDP